MNQSEPFKDRRKTKYYCALCGKYNIIHRLNHLINDHKSNANRHSTRYKPIMDVIFSEVQT